MDLPAQSSKKCFRVGSCNEVVLLSDDYLTDTKTLILWNPEIRKFITLSKPHALKSPHYCVYGFGFDSKRYDYKVLKVVYLHRDEGRAFPEVDLYSVNSGSWKTITASTSDYVIPQTMWYQIFVNGAVHWIAYCNRRNNCCNVVLSFNLSDETFQEIQLPEDLACKFPKKCLVISSVGKSILVKRCDQKRHNVWVMREYGVVGSWKKQFSVALTAAPNSRVLQVMGARKSVDLLLEVYDCGRRTGGLVSHDPNNRKNEFLGVHQIRGIHVWNITWRA